MVWGCISYSGVGKLVVVDGSLDSIGYVKLLSDNLHESANMMNLGEGFIFQQDNASCHVSNHTMKFFTANEIELLEWAAQSPDLNPIENLWSFMKKELSKMVIKNKQDLITKFNEIWSVIPEAYVKNLIDSMSRRIEEVLRSNGGPTSY